MPQEKQEFRNATDGTIGVVVVQPGGKQQGIPLVAGATVWLSEEDQIATANAPRRDEDNPFVNGNLEPVGVPEGVKNRRPIGGSNTDTSQADAEQREKAEAEARAAKEAQKQESAAQRQETEARQKEGVQQAQRGGSRPAVRRQGKEETGAPPQPQGKAAEGSRAAGEEVGTPEAAAKPS